ncbi:MAG TPA: PSD1 and planctomycete cytochrome C domain-containing protein [Pirellulales bacterium]|nr:PSD1 and planctomycete cytochrome C domain-containing protein [Pirellulales bacterium]
MPKPASAEDLEFFERQVRPVLANHCGECHGAKKQEAGLRLDNRASIVKGSDTGAVVVAGDPATSKLIAAVNYNDDNLQMPPDGKLPGEAIAALSEWVKRGLPWPVEAVPTADADAWRRHWAFQPLRAPVEPAVRQKEWARSPLDLFILARLEAEGFEPSSPADRRTWLRRVTYDLVGLPPTAGDFEAFAADTSPGAEERVVERLLASPAYGERWGRHWLDCARYADTKGYLAGNVDRNYPNAYKYRDWVVRALNDDMPYDQFLVQQIAADRLPEPNPGTLAALGFLTVGRRFLGNVADTIDDRLDTLCRTTMGLTISCARCHDHKFDPIGIKDYYSLYGVLDSTVEPKEPADLMTLADGPNPHNVRVFLRGSSHNLGDEAPRQFLPCVAGDKLRPFTQGSGRLELAQAIASRDNPLTARVMVNRVWLNFFGAGLVRTPSDFGRRSDPPTHPELLNFLAWRFMEEGWSLKKLHRLIVLSSTYRQSSHETEEMRRRDPSNLLLGRMSRRRLDLEAMRDSLLAAAGTLDAAVGGPAVDMFSEPFTHRRTIYGQIERQNLPGLFRTFDFASPDTHNAQRFTTTVPQQALFLLNSPFVNEQARALAGRSDVQSQADARGRVVQLYRCVLGREPIEAEIQPAVEFATTGGPTTSPTVWRYGYGEWDPAARKLQSFDELPHWTGTAWQGGKELPDPALNYLQLYAEGGHPGVANRAIVRRFVVTQPGVAKIEAVLKHERPEGDGVEAHILVGERGDVGRWVAHNGQIGTNVADLAVKPGDTIDFVAVCRANNGFDRFAWKPVVRLMPATADAGSAAGGASLEVVWDAGSGFHGPVPGPLDVWQRLAHTLLLTNEFMYLD